VADGVDLARQAVVLRELGCRRGQGLLFAGPLDNQRLRRVLHRRSYPLPRPSGSALSSGPTVLPQATLSDVGRGRRVRHRQAADLPERRSDVGPHDETPVPPA
jgi:hypothetical protein